jgi:hypothetical protein
MSSVAFKLINWGKNFRLATKPEHDESDNADQEPDEDK